MASAAKASAVGASSLHLESHEQLELDTILRRFADLPARVQLEAFALIHAYLDGDVKEIQVSREIANRKAALQALQQVADELGLPAGRAPTTTQFRAVSKQLGLDWSVSKVARTWGRWRFACEAYIGHRLRQTARQRGVLEVGTRKRRIYEDPTPALRLWLRSEPMVESIKGYDAWSREFNEALPDGQKPVLQWWSIQRILKVGFKDALRLARGETTLAEIQREPDHPREHGPLVATAWITSERELSLFLAREISRKPDFPNAVAKLSGLRVWLKDDVLAYFDGRAFPKRAEFELQDDYLSLRQLAALMGKRPAMISRTTRLPEPAGMVSKRRYWLRSEAKRWLGNTGAGV